MTTESRARELAFDLLAALERVASYEYAMDHVFSAGLRARIRILIKEAHGE